MAILVMAHVEGVNEAMHTGMLKALEASVRGAPGFIGHLAGPNGDAFRVLEIWETKDDAVRFFADFVHPNLPPGVRPQRTYHELSAVLLTAR
jgi:hypothetical protein